MTEEIVFRRLLLALPEGRLSAIQLQSIAGLAMRMEMELATLFVEDERLLRAVRLPIAIEMGRVSARVRHLGGPEIESSLHASAEAARHALEAVARQFDLPFTFRVARGRPVSTALELAQEMDAILFPAFAAPRTGHVRGRHPPVFAVLPPDEGLARTLSTALRLARAVEADLILGISAASEEDYARLRGEVAALLGAEAVAVRFFRLRVGDVSEVAGAARGLHAGLIVAPATLSPEALAELLPRLHCPLLLPR